MIYLLPFIAALIGWVTNYLAIKMLFHPRVEKRVLGFRIQGVFPKRQKDLANKLGQIVSDELFSMEDVKARLVESAHAPETRQLIESKIDEFLKEKLPSAVPMVAMFMNSDLAEKIKRTLASSLSEAIPHLVDMLGEKLDDAVDVHEIVRQKVEGFSSDKLEEILFAIMSKEFRFIEIIGAVLGFVIGVIQVLLLMGPQWIR